MIEDKLEIVIITYNRAPYLDNTLLELFKSPFLSCKITILDNCSDDETPEVCAKYKELFLDFNIIRHPKNIGANPNILRAVETSSSIYTWILCDDDSFDFEDCDDVIDQIESEEIDLILISSDQYLSGFKKGIKTTSQKLISDGLLYYHTLSFVPSTIFKTELFDSHCLQKGYFNVVNLYPHFEFINKSVEDDFNIYVSKNVIIKAGNEIEPAYSQIFWLISWMNSCTTIKNKNIRKKTIYELPTNESFLNKISMTIVDEKIGENDFRKYIQLVAAFVLAFGFSRDIVLLIIVLPLILIPGFFYSGLIRILKIIR